MQRGWIVRALHPARAIARRAAGLFWAVRGVALLVMVVLGGLTFSASAQIVGAAQPGTPGAIEGEGNPPRLRGARPRATPASNASLAAEPLRGTSRFSLRRNANPAIRRAPANAQASAPRLVGSSPAGRPLSLGASRVTRRPGDLTGLGPANPSLARDAGGFAPAVSEFPPAPGLPPVPPRQPRRQAPEADPYAPLGLRLGTFLVRPAIEVSGGYETNPSRASGRATASPFYRTEAEFRATSDWAAHQLDIDLRGSFSGFTALSSANRPEGDARIALRLDVNRDLTVDSELRSRVDTEIASSLNLPNGIAGRTPFFTHSAALGATQRFGRLSVNLRGFVDRSQFSNAQTNTGGTFNQATRDLVDYGLRLRGAFEITPGLTPFAEAVIDQRDYDLELDASGFRRSSRGIAARAGTSFEIERTLTGEVSLGYFYRAYEDSRLASLKSPLVDGSLTWSISPLTTLNLRAQSQIAETTIANSSGATVYQGTATLTHAFLRNFTATTTLGLNRTDYDGVDRQETGFIAGLRLEYKFNRLLALRGSYLYDARWVNTPGENYTSHTFTLGLRATP